MIKGVYSNIESYCSSAGHTDPYQRLSDLGTAKLLGMPSIAGSSLHDSCELGDTSMPLSVYLFIGIHTMACWNQLLNKPQQLTRNVRKAACAQIFRNLHDKAICYHLDHVSLGIENMWSSRGNFFSRCYGYVYGKGSETIDWLFRLSGIERRA